MLVTQSESMACLIAAVWNTGFRHVKDELLPKDVFPVRSLIQKTQAEKEAAIAAQICAPKSNGLNELTWQT